MSESEYGRLTQDEVYHLLSNPRRRFVIAYLREHGEPVELGTLSKEVAAWENETSVDRLTDQQEKRVYVSLYQTHIPKLDDAGVVDYDSDSGEITLTDRVSQLDRYLPADGDGGVQWRDVYVGLALAGVVLYLLVTFDAPLFGAIPETVVGLLIVVAFVATSAVQYLTADEGGERAAELFRREDGGPR